MPAGIIQIILAAMQMAPFAIKTIRDMREIIARDPAVPEELKALLLSTEVDNQMVITSAQKWLNEHPEV